MHVKGEGTILPGFHGLALIQNHSTSGKFSFSRQDGC